MHCKQNYNKMLFYKKNGGSKMLAKDYLHLCKAYTEELKNDYNGIEPEIGYCENSRGQLEHVICHPKDKDRKISSFRWSQP